MSSLGGHVNEIATSRIDESNMRSYPGSMSEPAAVALHDVTTLSQSALARERVLPVLEPLAPLLPDGGLVRGKAVSSGGPASTSLALALAVQATATGSWLAVVDVPTFGLEAADEFGIPLERVVRVDPPNRNAVGQTWAELVAATLDGFEVVITRVPPRLNPGLARRVQSRLKVRGAVLIAIGQPGQPAHGSGRCPDGHGSVSADIELVAADPEWEGVADGSGYLRGRRVVVTASGRRVPHPRRAPLWLP